MLKVAVRSLQGNVNPEAMARCGFTDNEPPSLAQLLLSSLYITYEGASTVCIFRIKHWSTALRNLTPASCWRGMLIWVRAALGWPFFTTRRRDTHSGSLFMRVVRRNGMNASHRTLLTTPRSRHRWPTTVMEMEVFMPHDRRPSQYRNSRKRYPPPMSNPHNVVKAVSTSINLP